MNAKKLAKPDHPIHELISRRWSPCAFADRAIPKDDLRSLFEAARWAASSYNEQPWSYIVAAKGESGVFEQLLSCLVEANQAWASTAPVLALGCANTLFARNGKSNAAALHDLGAASASLTIEATARGLAVHQMVGILPDRARELFHIPEGVQPLAALAIGYAADPNALPEPFRDRDLAPRSRKSVAAFVFGDKWGATSDLVG